MICILIDHNLETSKYSTWTESTHTKYRLRYFVIDNIVFQVILLYIIYIIYKNVLQLSCYTSILKMSSQNVQTMLTNKF